MKRDLHRHFNSDVILVIFSIILAVIYVDDGIEKSFLQNFKHPFVSQDSKYDNIY